MPKHLTPMQSRVLKHVAASIHERGYSPTHRELMALCGVKSTATIKYAIDALIRKGLLVRTGVHLARGLSLPKAAATLEQQAASWLALGAVVVGTQCADGSLSAIEVWQNRDGKYVRVEG